MDRTPKGITRRQLGRMGASFVLGAAAAPLLARSAKADSNALVTELPEHAALITALKYVNESTTAGQNCSGCILYTAGEGGKGKCTLFTTGMVSEKGWCASWAKKPA